MSSLDTINPAELEVVKFPDPRLRAPNARVEVFDEKLTALVEAMYDMMVTARGVGLAGPQVGVNLMLFTINPTGEPEDNRVFINPVLSEFEGRVEDEEGCLSLPGVNCRVKRFAKLTIAAQDLRGESFTERIEGFPARICQHEFDHLEGTLLVDRMSTLAKISNRAALQQLRDQYGTASA